MVNHLTIVASLNQIDLPTAVGLDDYISPADRSRLFDRERFGLSTMQRHLAAQPLRGDCWKLATWHAIIILAVDEPPSLVSPGSPLGLTHAVVALQPPG